jgi:3-oxoacyl-[acyl-carrier-protein] synthase II
MGEGGVMLMLETREHAERRDAVILAELLGYGACADAYRVTDGREDGAGSAEAMRRALADAGLAPEDIQYVNAHGTGTRLNDKTETRAIRDVFGRHADRTPVSSTKSQIGHLIAAAGAVEAAASVLALQHQLLPPTINYRNPDPECDLDVVPNAARPALVETIMSNSFGFGGQNACLIMRHGDAS